MKPTKRIVQIFLLIVSCLLIFLILFLTREFLRNYSVKFNLQNIDVPKAGSRVLVFSPHNDDEVLGAGQFIKKSVKNGCTVKIVFITNGDGYKAGIQFDYFDINPKPKDYIKFGYTRQKESLKAAGLLGLTSADLIFLGYPDGGIANLWNTHWDKSEPFTSKYTQTNKSPYNNSFSPDAVYAGESVISDITRIIKDFRPDTIILPHPNDRHPDHWATNSFVKVVLAETGYKPEKELLYLVHRGDWPTPMKRNTNLYLVPPEKLLNTGTDWFSLPLTKAETTEKGLITQIYKTQIKTLGLLMTAFERKNELFGEYPDLKIIQNIRSDKDVTPDAENKVIIDPLQDAISLEIGKNADISAVYAEISKEKNLHIFLQLDSEVEKTIDYNLGLFFIGKSGASRLNLRITEKGLASVNKSSISITSIAAVKTNINGRVIHFVIPASVSGEFSNLLINSTTSLETYMLDKTAWRMLINISTR